MPRPLLLCGRYSRIGGCYAITTVVRDSNPVLTKPCNAEIIRHEFQTLAAEGAVLSHAWVVMPDHLHWLFQLQDGSLGQCMQRFKLRAARAVNGHMKRSGALWQAGYYEHCIGNEEALARQARYLVENTLRKGLASTSKNIPTGGVAGFPGRRTCADH